MTEKTDFFFVIFIVVVILHLIIDGGCGFVVILGFAILILVGL